MDRRQELLREFWFVFFNESVTLDEIEELEKIFLLTAAFKEDKSMFSSEFEEGFGLCLRLYNKALIDQLVRSIRENIPILVFVKDLPSFGPYFKTVVRIFSYMNLTIGQ